MRDIFARVAVPVADQLTRGAFLGGWRLMAIDGFEWDAPDTPGNAAEFGYPGGGQDRAAFREWLAQMADGLLAQSAIDRLQPAAWEHISRRRVLPAPPAASHHPPANTTACNSR